MQCTQAGSEPFSQPPCLPAIGSEKVYSLLRADWSIAPCWIDQRDPTTVAAEVVLVECEQALLGMREHRRHDIGVMDLASRNWNRSTQLGQQVGDMGSVFQDVELRYEPVNVPDCSRHW